MGGLFTKLYEYLFNKKLEICLIGLKNTGKTTFVNILMGVHKQNLPTIGLNVKQVKKGSKFFIKFIFRFNNENMGYRWSISISAKLGRLCQNGRCNCFYDRWQ